MSLAERRFLAWYTDMLEGELGHFQVSIPFDYQCLSLYVGWQQLQVLQVLLQHMDHQQRLLLTALLLVSWQVV